MDFQMLTRRDLQALCKRNKIPANIANVAMVEALKALEFVEGIEEFSQTCQSETAQSSIESPSKMEVTSPYVPPTGGRSTRRRTVVKDETETAKPSARAPRTARKVQIASACKNMDFVDEEKSGVSVTPAPSAATTRRRRAVKEESTVNHTYSTRRSARLAVKNVETSNEAGNENLDFPKKGLFNNDCDESKMNLNEGPSDLDEASGITGGVDADSTMEVNSEKEVISAEKQDMSMVEDEVSNLCEAVGAKLELKDTYDVVEVTSEKEVEVKQEMSTVDMVEPVPSVEADGVKLELEDTYHVVEVNSEKEVEEKQEMPTIDMGEPVPSVEADGAKLELKDTYDVVEVNSEKEVEEKQEMPTIVMGEPVPSVEADSANLEMKDTCDVEIEEAGFGSETDSEWEKVEHDGTDEVKAEENEGTFAVETSEIEVEEVVQIEQNQAANCGENVVLESENVNMDEVVPESEVSLDVQPSEIKIDLEKTEEQTSDKDNGALVIEQQNTEMDAVSDLESADDSEDFEDETEENDSTDSEDSDDESEENDSTASEVSDEEIEENVNTVNVNKEVHEIIGTANVNEKDDVVVDDEMKDAQVLTPTKACARTPAVSDNKENIQTSENVEATKARREEKKLQELSVRQLTKMLKKKLNIDHKSCENEVVPAAARQALQVLPENRQA